MHLSGTGLDRDLVRALGEQILGHKKRRARSNIGSGDFPPRLSVHRQFALEFAGIHRIRLRAEKLRERRRPQSLQRALRAELHARFAQQLRRSSGAERRFRIALRERPQRDRRDVIRLTEARDHRAAFPSDRVASVRRTAGLFCERVEKLARLALALHAQECAREKCERRFVECGAIAVEAVRHGEIGVLFQRERVEDQRGFFGLVRRDDRECGFEIFHAFLDRSIADREAERLTASRSPQRPRLVTTESRVQSPAMHALPRPTAVGLRELEFRDQPADAILQRGLREPAASCSRDRCATRRPPRAANSQQSAARARNPRQPDAAASPYRTKRSAARKCTDASRR